MQKKKTGKKAEKGGKKRKGQYFGIQKKRGGAKKARGKAFFSSMPQHAGQTRAQKLT